MMIANNKKKQRYEYEILLEFDAGIVLVGNEVKSIRER
jgi:tmRNA-binding protein